MKTDELFARIEALDTSESPAKTQSFADAQALVSRSDDRKNSQRKGKGNAANTTNNQVTSSKIATKRCESIHNEFMMKRKAPAILKSQKVKRMSHMTGKQVLLNILHLYIVSLHPHSI